MPLILADIAEQHLPSPGDATVSRMARARPGRTPYWAWNCRDDAGRLQPKSPQRAMKASTATWSRCLTGLKSPNYTHGAIFAWHQTNKIIKSQVCEGYQTSSIIGSQELYPISEE